MIKLDKLDKNGEHPIEHKNEEHTFEQMYNQIVTQEQVYLHGGLLPEWYGGKAQDPEVFIGINSLLLVSIIEQCKKTIHSKPLPDLDDLDRRIKARLAEEKGKSMNKNEITFEDILLSGTQPGYYGQKYLNANTEGELLFVLGEACNLSAFKLVKILKLPNRGNLILALIKTFSPQSYEKHQFLWNFSFSHCLIYISRKLKEVLRRKLSEEDAGRISSTAYAYGGSFWGFISGYSQEDKEKLLREIEQRIYDYDKSEIINEKLLLENIIKGLGRKIPPKQVAVQAAIFFRETIMKDPLYVVEPFHFIDRFKGITTLDNKRDAESSPESSSGQVSA